MHYISFLYVCMCVCVCVYIYIYITRTMENGLPFSTIYSRLLYSTPIFNALFKTPKYICIYI